MKTRHPKALGVKALQPYKLEIAWDTGETLMVDVEKKLRGVPILEKILVPEIFAKAHISEWGGSIEWFDTEFGDDNVYAWTREQMGEMSHEMFDEWMVKNNLSLSGAAEALGISRRMIAYYHSGAKPIPKPVWLACRGFEMVKKEQKRKEKKAA